MVYGLAEAVPARDRKRPSGEAAAADRDRLSMHGCLPVWPGRRPCDQRPFPVEVFVEVGEDFVEEAFVEVEETAFAFETPIFL